MAKGGKLQGMDDFVKTGKLSGISFHIQQILLVHLIFTSEKYFSKCSW